MSFYEKVMNAVRNAEPLVIYDGVVSRACKVVKQFRDDAELLVECTGKFYIYPEIEEDMGVHLKVEKIDGCNYIMPDAITLK